MSGLLLVAAIALLFVAVISAISAVARRALAREQHAEGTVRVLPVVSEEEKQKQERPG